MSLSKMSIAEMLDFRKPIFFLSSSVVLGAPVKSFQLLRQRAVRWGLQYSHWSSSHPPHTRKGALLVCPGMRIEEQGTC